METPTSEPGFCMTDGMWDSDAESDTEDFVFKHHVSWQHHELAHFPTDYFVIILQLFYACSSEKVKMKV